MLDINFIRENVDQIKKAIQDKRIDLNLDELLKVDEERRGFLKQVEDLNRRRNELSDQVAKADSQGRQQLIEQAQQIKKELEELEPKLADIRQKFDELMVKVPTIPAQDTPPGTSDADNPVIFETDNKPQFDFKPLDHIELSKKLDIIDFERGAKVAGYRGYYLKNEGAILVMAIMLYALRKLISAGYTPMIPPTLIKQFALFGSGYFKGLDYNDETDEIYQVVSSDREESGEKSADKKFLVGTAEPSLLAYYCGETLNEDQLPMKICGFSQCYRSEIGSYGKDTKGIYRVHEFFKVEQVVISPADLELSDKIQQEMIEMSKQMHDDLGLPYRQVRICAGDLSAGKYKQFDIEAWMPGSNRFGETGSASNFLDWQSRRLDVKYEEKQNKKKKHVFMLNNTALPSPRILIALLENHQQADGSVKIPEVLVPYTGFSEIRSK
jgi:seryl-tRNA synthetase